MSSLPCSLAYSRRTVNTCGLNKLTTELLDGSSLFSPVSGVCAQEKQLIRLLSPGEGGVSGQHPVHLMQWAAVRT